MSTRRPIKSGWRWVGVAVVIAALLAGGVVLRQPRVTSDVTDFLPVEGGPALEAVRQLTRSTLSRRVAILVDGDDAAANRRAVRAMAESLADTELFAEVNDAPADLAEATWAMYFPKRLNFLGESTRQLAHLNTEAGMAEAARRFRQALTGRYGPLVQRIGPKDPLLAYPGLLDRLQSLNRSSMGVSHGQYVTDEGAAALLLTLNASPFGSTYANRVDRAVSGSFADTGLADDALHIAGAYRYTHVISTSMKHDMTRITIVSLVLLMVLFGAVWGRVRWLAIPLVSVAVGGGVAGALTAIVFGSIHLLTVAFGASLIGVCVDYSIHVLNHYVGGGRIDKRLWKSIGLSAATTSIGFGALIGSDVPALRELAFFSATGIMSALATTYVISTRLLADTPPPSSGAYGWLYATVERLLGAWSGRRAAALVLAAAVVVPAAVGLGSVQWEDNLDALMNPAPELRAQEEIVRSKITGLSSANLVIIRGDDAERALQRNDRLADRLQRAVDAGAVSHFMSLHAAIWSKKRQALNQAFVREHGHSMVDLMRAAFGQAGVRPAKLAPVADGFDVPDSALTMADLEASPLAAMVAPFDAAGDGTVLVTYLGEVSNAERVQAAVDGVDGAVFVQQKQALNHGYVVFRRSLFWLSGVGLFVILLVLAAAYRDVRSTTVAVVPPLVAASATIGILSLLDIPIGLAHLMSLLMVIGIGVDYGVMLDGHHDKPAQLVLSLVLAYLTTCAAFGVLLASGHPVLHAIGATLLVGTTCSLLVVPAVGTLLLKRSTA